MNRLPVEEIWREIGKITTGFSLLECDKCAIAIMQWLSDNGIEGKILRLKTRRRSEVFITSDRWNPKESILSGAENFFESYDGQSEGSKWRLKPTALVRFFEKPGNRCLIENPLSIRASGVFCTTKGINH